MGNYCLWICRLTCLFGVAFFLTGCKTPALTIAVSGQGQVVNAAGEVICEDSCQITAAEGEVLSLRPVGVNGSVFSGWGSDCEGYGTCELVVGDTPYSVIAHFADYVPVAAGSFHTCAQAMGKVTCWGGNRFDQADMPASISEVDPMIDLSAGGDFPDSSKSWDGATCGIQGGVLSCWGSRWATAEMPSLIDPTQVSVGAEHICAIDQQQAICWGDNTAAATVPVHLDTVKEVAAGGTHSCAIDRQGVHCWGQNDRGQLDVPAGITQPRQLVTGGRHSCVIADEGVVCWGSNVSFWGRELGQASVPAGLQNPRALAAGHYHSCALDDNGVSCWGDDSQGNVSAVPTLVNPTQLSGGTEHTCAIDEGQAVCWGSNDKGQLLNPERYGVNNPTAVSMAGQNACVLDEERVICWGGQEHIANVQPLFDEPTALSVNTNNVCVVDGDVKCWGSTFFGVQTPPSTLVNPSQVSTSYAHACALGDTGVSCWGNDDDGRTDVPFLQDPRDIVAVTNGSCALDGDEVVCWGDYAAVIEQGPVLQQASALAINSSYACAIDSRGVNCWPAGGLTSGIDVPTLANPQGLSVSNYHGCAIDNQTVHCWGRFYDAAFVPEGIVNPIAVAAGDFDSCVIDDRGVVCWGDAKIFLPRVAH